MDELATAYISEGGQTSQQQRVELMTMKWTGVSCSMFLAYVYIKPFCFALVSMEETLRQVRFRFFARDMS